MAVKIKTLALLQSCPIVTYCLEHIEEKIWTLYGDDIIDMERSQHLIDVHFASDNEMHSILDEDSPF